MDLRTALGHRQPNLPFPTLKKRWAAFQKNYAYAQTVDWSHVVMGITHMLEWAM
jgi:hypothetical protein